MFCTWCGLYEYRQPGRRAKKFVTLGVNVCGTSVGITDHVTFVAREILFEIGWVFT